MNDFRIVVPENVELEHTAGNGMVIEMRCNRAGNPVSVFIFFIFLIGGILERRKIVDVHIARADHDAGRMLTGICLDPDDAGRNFFQVNIVAGNPHDFGVFFRDAVRVFLLQSGNGPGAEDIVAPEEFFRVLVRDALVVTGGEIEVDIGNFVAVESEEDGKRNVVSVFGKRRAARRAFSVR